MKEGFFEWIVSYEDIKEYLSPQHTCIDINTQLKILVVGCGTSTLSKNLTVEANVVEVVSIDNDSDCISYMITNHSNNDKMKWFTYDIIEDVGIKQNNLLDVDGYFDIVVDKGTFDAIHVEGSVSSMLFDVRRLLRTGGVYLLCSINSTELLDALMNIPSLQFEVSVHEIESSVYKGGSIALCKKIGNDSVDVDQIAIDERIISDRFFQTEHPLLTIEYERTVRLKFIALCHGQHQQSLAVEQAHEVIFGGDRASELLDYTLDLFLDDLSDFPLAAEGRMTVDEALCFIQQMQ